MRRIFDRFRFRRNRTKLETPPEPRTLAKPPAAQPQTSDHTGGKLGKRRRRRIQKIARASRKRNRDMRATGGRK